MIIDAEEGSSEYQKLSNHEEHIGSDVMVFADKERGKG